MATKGEGTVNRELKPMEVGDILDTAFRLYKERFAVFATIAAVVYLPYALLVAAITSWARSMMPTPAVSPGGLGGIWSMLERPRIPLAAVVSEVHLLSLRAPPFSGVGAVSPLVLIAGAVGSMIGLLVFLSLVYPLCTGALLVNISAGYLGEELGAAESYSRVFKKLGILLWAQFLVMLVVFAGLCVCVVPGIIASLWFMLVPAVALLETTDQASAVLGRSRALMADNLGKGFRLGFVVWLLSMVVTLGGSAILRLVPWPIAFIGDFLENILGALVIPLSIGVVVLFYYDLRIRKEGFDLQHLASRMGGLSRP
jgi:hypothetical protein